MARAFGNRQGQGAATSRDDVARRSKAGRDLARAIQRANGPMRSPDELLALQQTLGNKAVGSILGRKADGQGNGTVQRWPWDDWFGGKGGAGGAGKGGAGGADAGKGGAGGAEAGAGKGGFGGADAKGGAGPKGAGGPAYAPKGAPWAGVWNMYQDAKATWGSTATPIDDSMEAREEEPRAAY